MNRTLEQVIFIAIIFVLLAIVSYVSFVFSERKRLEHIIKANSLTFYRAFSSIKNKKQRYAIYAVYAFCRYADDLADEYKDEQGLFKLKTELDNYKTNRTAKSLIFRGLKRYTKDFYDASYDFMPFYRMIEGQIKDIHFKDIETLDELYLYCDLVAGTVGQMLLPILAPKHYDGLDDFAIGLGRGMQITNILRDIKEDRFENKRVYLPEELLTQYQYQKSDIDQGIMNENYVALFKHLSNIAYESYQKAINQLNRFEPDVRKPLGLAIVLYRGILDKAILMNYDVYSCRIVLSKEEKLSKINQFINSSKGE